jgi:hypothetical protein
MMVNKNVIQFIIGVVAAVGLVLALSTGGSLTPPMLLKMYSISVTAVTILFLLYDRYVWRWKWVRKINGIPLLAGTWRGTLVSSYVRPDGAKVGPIPTAIYVTQTASTVTATLFTGESSSISEQADLRREADGRWRLKWLYVNTPRSGVRDRSDVHYGASELYVGSQEGDGLVGCYFTDRKTTGELTLLEWSPHQFSSAASAHSSDSFKPIKPCA